MQFQPNPYTVSPQPAAATPEPETVTPAQAADGTASNLAGPSCGPGCSPPTTPALHDYTSNDDRGPCLRFWLSAEYLYWWVKSTPTPLPLVTTGSAADPIPGAIGQPHTSVLFGGGDMSYPGMSGFRLTFGGWIDNDNKFGLEGSGFILENGVVNYSNNGSAVLAVPITVVGPTFPNGRNTVPLSNPGAQLNPLNAGSSNPAAMATVGPYTGNISAALASQIWGAELNGYYNLFRHSGWTLDVLGGARYLNLTESLSINANSTDTTLAITNNYNDNFQTVNQFIGGQVGLRATGRYGCWTIDGTIKAAFGVNLETLTVNGATNQTSAAGTTTYAGGIFAQSSNIGTTHQTAYSFVPSANLKIGYDLSPNARVFLGYDMLYWMNVARASNQLDGNINPSQAYGGTLTGANNPATMFNHSNYFAQGVSAGIMFSY
jgi:hypothetical protein